MREEFHPVVVVEFLRDVVGQFQMLALVLADRHRGRVIYQDVGRHQVRIHVQPGRGVLAVLAGLVLELRHAVQPADPRHAIEDPAQPHMRRHRRLQEQDVFVRIDATGQQHRGHLPRLPGQFLRLLPLGDRVQIDHAIQALMLLLQRHPVADGAEVIAERGDAGGLDAGQDTVHGGDRALVDRGGMDGRSGARVQGAAGGARAIG